MRHSEYLSFHSQRSRKLVPLASIVTSKSKFFGSVCSSRSLYYFDVCGSTVVILRHARNTSSSIELKILCVHVSRRLGMSYWKLHIFLFHLVFRLQRSASSFQTAQISNNCIARYYRWIFKKLLLWSRQIDNSSKKRNSFLWYKTKIKNTQMKFKSFLKNELIFLILSTYIQNSIYNFIYNI